MHQVADVLESVGGKWAAAGDLGARAFESLLSISLLPYLS